MKTLRESLLRLLTLGALPRMGLVVAVIVLLWAAFFWATSPMGA